MSLLPGFYSATCHCRIMMCASNRTRVRQILSWQSQCHCQRWSASSKHSACQTVSRTPVVWSGRAAPFLPSAHLHIGPHQNYLSFQWVFLECCRHCGACCLPGLPPSSVVGLKTWTEFLRISVFSNISDVESLKKRKHLFLCMTLGRNLNYWSHLFHVLTIPR